MSRKKIDKAIYDKERYESLRERGVSEDRAKRVGTAPLKKGPPEESRRSAPLVEKESRVKEQDRSEGRREAGPKVKTTSRRTGI